MHHRVNQNASATRFFWNSQIFRGGELLVRKRLVQVRDKYPGICPFHCLLWTVSSPNSRTKPRRLEACSGHPGPSRYLRSLQRSVERKPQISAADLSQEMQLSVSSVRRYLGRLGYKGRAVRYKPLLQIANKARRHRWAKEMIKKPLDFWQAVIFSDESSFT